MTNTGGAGRLAVRARVVSTRNGRPPTHQAVSDLDRFEIKERDTHVVQVAKLSDNYLFIGKENAWLRPDPKFSCIIEIEVMQIGSQEVLPLVGEDYVLRLYRGGDSVDMIALEYIPRERDSPAEPEGQ